MYKKLFFWIISVGINAPLPIYAMHEHLEYAPGPGLADKTPKPIRLLKLNKLPLTTLEEPENYLLIEKDTEFLINDDKGPLHVTQVTPYQDHWLWGAHAMSQYKYFERPRFFHSTLFPFPLVTERGHVRHIQNNGKSTEYKVSSLTKWPTTYGVMATGCCLFLGWLTYFNVSRHK